MEASLMICILFQGKPPCMCSVHITNEHQPRANIPHTSPKKKKKEMDFDTVHNNLVLGYI